MSLWLFMSRLLFAWNFLTILPLGQRFHHPQAPELARSMRWYSFVGLLLGGMLVLLDHLLSMLLASQVVTMLLIVVLVVVTGGLHQDGLADTVDGLAGGKTPEQRLAIMRDSHIGALGATALLLDLGLRYVTLEAIPLEARWAVLLAMPMVGRWVMVVVAKLAPYARSEGGVAGPFLSHLTVTDVLWASLLPLFCLPLLLGGSGLVCGGLVVLLAWGGVRLVTSLCGGITGDTLGATNEMIEIMFVLLLPLFLRIA